MRFDEGVVRIKPDLEWVEKLSKRQKAVVAATTWPLLLYYGYFRRGGSAGTEVAFPWRNNDGWYRCACSSQCAVSLSQQP